jgi:hypothetical protein
MGSFWKHATRRHTVTRSLWVAFVVGTILGAINHYDMFVDRVYPPRRIAQILVTYLVPYCVATYGAAREGMRRE